jgi:hypothetical protein
MVNVIGTSPVIYDRILDDELVKPGTNFSYPSNIGILATLKFFEDISSRGDVDNVKQYVTPRFFQYLKEEMDLAGNYRPVHKVGPIAGGFPVHYLEPTALVGDPKIFEYVDTVKYKRQSGNLESSSKPIVKHRPANQPGSSFDFCRNLQIRSPSRPCIKGRIRVASTHVANVIEIQQVGQTGILHRTLKRSGFPRDTFNCQRRTGRI